MSTYNLTSSSLPTAVGTFLVDKYKQTSDPDDTLSFSRAATAMMAAGQGILTLSAKTYTVTALPTLTPPANATTFPYGMQGPGSSMCLIRHIGTSLASSLTVNDPNFNSDAAKNGAIPFRGFSLDGTNSSGGTSGISWSDISYVSFEDISINGFATGDGFKFPNTYGWTEGVRMANCRCGDNNVQVHFGVGVGQSYGTITTALSAGTAYTSIAVSGGITYGIYSGQPLVIYTPGGATSETVFAAANLNAGATSIPITSFTTTQSYAAGSAKVYVGSYGSFDYWTVESLYLYANPNQDGICSDVPLGINQQVDRVGSSWRITGNFTTGSTNTGAFLRIKGRDRWTEQFFDISIEVDGGQPTPHTAIVLATSESSVIGTGRFLLYYFGAASFAGGSWQFNLSGQIGIAGLYGDGTVTIFSGTTIRGTQYGVVPNGTAYASSVTPGTSYQNTTGLDVFVTVPVTFTATGGTAGWNVDTYSSLPAATAIAKGNSGFIVPLTFVHYANTWARIDGTNVTLGAPVVRIV